MCVWPQLPGSIVPTRRPFKAEVIKPELSLWLPLQLPATFHPEKQLNTAQRNTFETSSLTDGQQTGSAAAEARLLVSAGPQAVRVQC